MVYGGGIAHFVKGPLHQIRTEKSHTLIQTSRNHGSLSFTGRTSPRNKVRKRR